MLGIAENKFYFNISLWNLSFLVLPRASKKISSKINLKAYYK